MAPERDEAREKRIEMEIIVDAYDGEEQALGWYYYLENKLTFPFLARCITERKISLLRLGETVEVVALPDEDTAQAIDDCHYWVGMGCQFQSLLLNREPLKDR